MDPHRIASVRRRLHAGKSGNGCIGARFSIEENDMQNTIHTYEEHLRERVASESPEGRPAHATVGPKSFGAILIAVASVFVLLGVALAFLVQPIAAAVFVVLGLVVFAVNPEIWTAMLRGKERARVDERIVRERV